MNMTEIARLLLGLRADGWSEKKINDFLLYIETGDEHSRAILLFLLYRDPKLNVPIFSFFPPIPVNNHKLRTVCQNIIR